MQSIKHEFEKLKKRYNLPNLACEVIKDFHDARGYYFSVNDFTEVDCPFIVLRDYRVYQGNLRTLLHELCHAIQDKEGRFRLPKNHTRRKYALEVEAETFALSEYRWLYESEYGKARPRWNLASYDYYVAYNNGLDLDEVKRYMSDDEVVSFVFSLEGRSKKHILRRIDQQSRSHDWYSKVSRLHI